MRTSKGHDVEVVPGDAGAIASRGSQIAALGESMESAAKTLSGIKNDTVAGQGFAMDKIKDVIGTAHVDLDEAARRYKPAGTTLSNYSTALAAAQASMRTIVSDCETSVVQLRAAEGSASDASSALSSFNLAATWAPPAAEDEASNNRLGDTLADAASSARATLLSAQNEHDDNLARFDVSYDDWSTAYETAVSELSNANGIGADTTWENVAGVLAVISEWVGWIGLAVAVLGLLIGSPFLAIAALVIGVIALGLTIALMFDGRKGWGDLAMSVVGILPIGKLGSGFGTFFKAIPKQLTGPVGQIRHIRNISAVPKNGWKIGSKANFAEFVSKVSKTRMTGPFTLSGLGQRFLGGTNRSFTLSFQENVAAGTGYGKRLINQMPQVLRDMSKGSPTVFEQSYNVYKWADKTVALTNGRPSGGLSPAGMINRVFR